MTDHESLEQRVARLEDVAFEGDGLARAVTRLGLNANALGEAILTVDRNQQRLTRLGQQLEKVEANTVTTQDHEIITQELRDDIVRSATSLSRNLRKRAYIACVLVLIASMCGVYYAYWSAAERTHNECTTRVANSKAAVAFYEKQLARTDLSPGIRSILASIRVSAQKGAQINCGPGPWPHRD